jgi:hypothetical protein
MGDRAPGQTALSKQIFETTTVQQGDTHSEPHALNSIGEVARSRSENPRQRYWIASAATPQSLERGSSVTNNSLAANQRPHISLIDRRHR